MDKRRLYMGKEKNKTTYELNWHKKYVAHWTDASLLSDRQYWQDIEEKTAINMRHRNIFFFFLNKKNEVRREEKLLSISFKITLFSF